MKPGKTHGKPPCLFKVDISYSKYESFVRYYKKADTKEMLYLYFDTDLRLEEARLFRSNVRLRARIRGDRYSLELKHKTEKENLSQNYYQPISLFELNFMLQGSVPNGEIRKKLLDLSLLDKVLLVGTAHTTRAKKSFQQGILVLDKTISANEAHFQIEFRSEQPVSDEKLVAIKKELDIPGSGLFQGKLKRIWAMSEN